jgi:hypothetical protein
MTAGLNIAIAIWHYTTPSDDAGGGALASGTYSYPYVNARMEQSRADSLLLQQGLEVVKVWNVLCQPANLLVYERDEIEVVWPNNHRYFHQRFRIVSVEESSINPDVSTGNLLLRVVRREISHANQ